MHRTVTPERRVSQESTEITRRLAVLTSRLSIDLRKSSLISSRWSRTLAACSGGRAESPPKTTEMRPARLVKMPATGNSIVSASFLSLFRWREIFEEKRLRFVSHEAKAVASPAACFRAASWKPADPRDCFSLLKAPAQ